MHSFFCWLPNTLLRSFPAKPFWVLLLAAGLHCSEAVAQTSRFNFGVVAGLNFSELEGDGIMDYFGLNAGVISTAKLSRHTQLSLELLFSQNGEYILPQYYPPIAYGPIWLNHIEIPVHFDWLIEVYKKGKYADWNVNLGLAYAQLLSYRVKDAEKQDVSDLVSYGNRHALLIQPGTTYFFTQRFGVNLKASLPLRTKGLSWTLAARAVYMIN